MDPLVIVALITAVVGTIGSYFVAKAGKGHKKAVA